MATNRVILQILEVKLVKSKLGRYLFRFKFSCNVLNGDLKFYHDIFLGNYKDYQKDKQEKHNILWNMFFDKLHGMGIYFEKLEQGKVIGKKFYAEIYFRNVYIPTTSKVPVSIDIKKFIKPYREIS